MIRPTIDTARPDTAGTETHLSVDDKIALDLSTPAQAAMREGFAASYGIRQETAETGGRVRQGQTPDRLKDDPTPASLRNENAGLADH